jgi:hypothetical protein
MNTLIEANNDDLEEHYSDLDELEEKTPVERYVSGDVQPKNKKDLN